MLKNYIKTAIRSLLKNRLFSVINISGLAIGLVSFAIIMLYVNYELSYDRFYDKAENIYRVYMDYLEGDQYEPGDAQTYNLTGPTLKKEFAEVLDFFRLYRLDKTSIEFDNEIIEVPNGHLADPSYLTIFSTPLLSGDIKSALVEPNSIVLTQHISKKIFGDANPIGKSIIAYHSGQKTMMTVTGILEDIPENTHMKTNFLVSFSTFYKWRVTNPQELNWNNNNFFTYLLLDKNANIDGLRQKLAKMDVPLDGERHNIEALTSIHLYSDKPYEAEANGNATRVKFLLAIGIIILVLSWLNYINLTTSKSSERTKEIGVRKVSGARKNQLVAQFISESLLLNLLALALATGVVVACLPYFEAFSGKQLLAGLSWNTTLLWLAGIPLIGTFLSSVYPAVLLSGFNPSGILKGSIKSYYQSSGIRTGLIIAQFMITIVLMIGTFTIIKQIKFIEDQPLGINLDQVISIKGEIIDEKENFATAFTTLREEIQNLPYVKAVSSSWTYPGEGYDNLGSFMSLTYPDGTHDARTNWFTYEADHAYIPLMNLKLLAGANFSESPESNRGQVIINEAALKKLGFQNPEYAVNQKIHFWGQDRFITGVIQDYHHFGLKNEIEPLILRFEPITGGLLVKLDQNYTSIAGTKEAIDGLNEIWEMVFPKSAFQYSFVEAKFAAQYQEDTQFGKVFSFFTFLAIFIASLGLFGLASYRCMVRTKEIGVRKVNGAKVSEILTMLNKDFIRWIVIALVIASPIAWFAMNNWLENFAYRTDLSWWIFSLAGLLALGIALLTVSWQSWKAATRNPVEALRYE